MRKMIQLLLVTITLVGLMGCKKKDNYKPVTVADPKTHLLGKWTLIKTYKPYPEKDARWKDVNNEENGTPTYKYSVTFNKDSSFIRATSKRTSTGHYYFDNDTNFSMLYLGDDVFYNYTFYFTRSDKLVLEYYADMFDNQGNPKWGIVKDLFVRVE